MPLTEIATVVEHFGVPRSTLHYWERRGLLTAHRRGGRRCYDEDQLYRISLIQAWQTTGRMSLDDIASMLTARATDPNWRAAVATQIAAIEHSMAELETARRYLDYLLTCRSDGELERCPNYRASVTLPAASR